MYAHCYMIPVGYWYKYMVHSVCVCVHVQSSDVVALGWYFMIVMKILSVFRHTPNKVIMTVVKYTWPTIEYCNLVIEYWIHIRIHKRSLEKLSYPRPTGTRILVIFTWIDLLKPTIK